MSEPGIIFDPPRIDRLRLGLKDGGDITLRCSNCNRGLVSIKVTIPDAQNAEGKPITWNVRASCGYDDCRGPKGKPFMSFTHEVRGAYHHKPFTVPDPNNPDEVIQKTAIVDLEDDGSVITFHTKPKRVKK